MYFSHVTHNRKLLLYNHRPLVGGTCLDAHLALRTSIYSERF